MNRQVTQKEYIEAHKFLRESYGPANFCENLECTKDSTRYEWALKHGYKHEKNRDNYQMLCRTCHGKYDFIHRNKGHVSNPTQRITLHWIRECAFDYILKNPETKEQILKFVQYLEQKHRSRTQSAKRPNPNTK